MVRHIEVWLDAASDIDEPVWCVSLCEDDGQEVRCFSVHDEKADAEAAAERLCEKGQLNLVRR